METIGDKTDCNQHAFFSRVTCTQLETESFWCSIRDAEHTFGDVKMGAGKRARQSGNRLVVKQLLVTVSQKVTL